MGCLCVGSPMIDHQDKRDKSGTCPGCVPLGTSGGQAGQTGHTPIRRVPSVPSRPKPNPADLLSETEGENDRAPWPRFGPWAEADVVEQAAVTRELRALALLLCGPSHPLTAALAAAVADPATLDHAAAELSRLPALRRRRLLATAAALWRPARPR